MQCRLCRYNGLKPYIMLNLYPDGTAAEKHLLFEDYCLDNYCVQCFWKCHFNGHSAAE